MTKSIITRIISKFEKLLLLVPVKISRPIIFITGAPRSGSTITYQYFVELGDFCFFTNFDRKYFRFPIISALFLKTARKYRPTNENSYGHIPGKYSPSDGWEIFHRWFPYYYDPDQLMKKGAERELYRTIAWFQKIYRKPFIVKNNANSLRISELKRIFPDAIFIHVERDRREVIESIAKGMRANNINRSGLWGTGPRVDLIPKSIVTNEEKAKFQYDFINDYVSNFPFIIRLQFDKNRMDDLKVQVTTLVNEFTR